LIFLANILIGFLTAVSDSFDRLLCSFQVSPILSRCDFVRITLNTSLLFGLSNDCLDRCLSPLLFGFSLLSKHVFTGLLHTFDAAEHIVDGFIVN
jgi:hypothetical protein